jgi:PASTA domain
MLVLAVVLSLLTPSITQPMLWSELWSETALEGNFLPALAAGGVLGAQALLQLPSANCDGAVAALAAAVTAAELTGTTVDPSSWLHEVNCPGTDSSAGCGGNSNYDVSYVIANLSLTTVPDLLGKSPQAAETLARQAGLFLSTISSQTGSPKVTPHVEDQAPQPGSQVPPASWIDANIVLPVPHGRPEP